MNRRLLLSGKLRERRGRGKSSPRRRRAVEVLVDRVGGPDGIRPVVDYSSLFIEVGEESSEPSDRERIREPGDALDRAADEEDFVDPLVPLLIGEVGGIEGQSAVVVLDERLERHFHPEEVDTAPMARIVHRRIHIQGFPLQLDWRHEIVATGFLQRLAERCAEVTFARPVVASHRVEDMLVGDIAAHLHDAADPQLARFIYGVKK